MEHSVPANSQSTFLKRYLLLVYQQCFVDSASCTNHINMRVKGREKSFVVFQQVACSLGLAIVLSLVEFLVCYCLSFIFPSYFFTFFYFSDQILEQNARFENY